MLFTPVAPATPDIEHLLKACLVRFSRARPGTRGLLVTLSVNDADLHVTPFFVPGVKKVTLVPDFTLACRIALTFTFGPPTLLIVRTACRVAAEAVTIGK